MEGFLPLQVVVTEGVCFKDGQGHQVYALAFTLHFGRRCTSILPVTDCCVRSSKVKDTLVEARAPMT